MFADYTDHVVLDVELEGYVKDLHAGRAVPSKDDNDFNQALGQ